MFPNPRALLSVLESAVSQFARALELALGGADALASRLTGAEARLAALERQAAMATMTAWLRHAGVRERLLVSVVLPTRGPRERLEAAIASVAAQSYRRWELLVVDDGASGDVEELLDELEDERIRSLRTDDLGLEAAGDVALAFARGDVVTYLDDGCRLDPEWLKAIALTFAARPEADACVGARVSGEHSRHDVLAHRRGADGFHEPLEVPAVAAYAEGAEPPPAAAPPEAPGRPYRASRRRTRAAAQRGSEAAASESER